jgi:hypothetical protein
MKEEGRRRKGRLKKQNIPEEAQLKTKAGN